MSNHISHAALPYIVKGARFSILIPYMDGTGAPTDPTAPDTEFSLDDAASGDCAEETTAYRDSVGLLTLTGAETNGSALSVAAKGTGVKTTLFTFNIIPLVSIGTGTLSAGSAGGGTLGTILPYDLTGCFVKTTGGTGGGGTGGANNQARKMMTYVPSTGVFTVTPNWETAPDNTTNYEVLLPDGVTLGMLKALNPATAGRNVVVDAAGLVDANAVKIGPTGAGVALTGRNIGAKENTGIILEGTAQAGAAGSITLPPAAVATSNYYNGCTVLIESGTGAGQSPRVGTSYVGGTKVLSVEPNWTVNPDNTSVVKIFGTAPQPDVTLPSVDLNKWRGSQPNVLISGRVESVIGAVTAGVIGAAAFAAGALDAVWSTATRTLSNGSIAAATFVAGALDAVWSTAARALTDKAGFSLSAPGVQAIWDALTANLTTANTIGKRLADNVDATISSRLATAGYTSPPSAATISTTVWTEPIPGAFGAGTAGLKLNSASSAGDPWATVLPGGYAANTAGNLLGNRLDAAISSRLATGAYVAPDNAGITSIFTRIGAPIGASISADIQTRSSFDPATSIVEGAITWVQSARGWNSGIMGKSSGLEGVSPIFRDMADTKNRIVASVDAFGNRTAIARDLT